MDSDRNAGFFALKASISYSIMILMHIIQKTGLWFCGVATPFFLQSKVGHFLAIGLILILIALRLFFPVREFKVFTESNGLNFSSIVDKGKYNYEKSIVVSKTLFLSLGIALLSGGFILIYELKRKPNS